MAPEIEIVTGLSKRGGAMHTVKTTTRERGIRWGLGALAAVALMALVPARPEAANGIGCGSVLTGDETYVLTGDVADCPGGGPAITVVGPATLKLNGWTVSCFHTIGLDDSEDPVNPTPSTEDVAAGSVGVLLTGEGAELLGAGSYAKGKNQNPENRVMGCERNVVLAGDGKHEVNGVHSVQSTVAAFVVESDWNELTGNVVRQNFREEVPGDDPQPVICGGTGYVVEGDHNEIFKNVAADCEENGFQIDGNENRVEDNTARDNEEYGFGIDGAENRIHANVAAKNVVGGFLVEEGEGNTLGHNTATQNGDGEPADGFDILGNGNTLKSNVADNNGLYGIFVGGEDNTLTENTVNNTGYFGVGPVGTDLFDNHAGCGSNQWFRNIFGTRNQPCIR
jgi:parallel beta-helix repeat protein